MDFPYGETVTVKSVTTTTNSHGDSSATPQTATWGPCAIAPRFATENTDPHAPSLIVGLTVYGPPRTIDADDLLVIRGVEYAVDGLPGDWTNPFTGWAPGIEVPVKRAGVS